MDPDETLKRIRVLADGIDSIDGSLHPERGLLVSAREMAELFHALDEWMSAGGFKPRDWR